MKTSFYFVVWTVIYPILGLFHYEVVEKNAFVVALVAVWGLSWLLNKSMPETLAYERALQVGPVLEEVYTGNVGAFRKRLTRHMWIESLTATYFLFSTVAIMFMAFAVGGSEWFALLVFAFFMLASVSRAAAIIKALVALKKNPTREECREIAEKTLKLNYEEFYEERVNWSLEEMLADPPKHFRAFQWFSLIVAAVAAILGLVYLGFGITIMVKDPSLEGQAFAGMSFLYGGLAIYFGVRGFVTVVEALGRKVKKNEELFSY